MDHKRQFDSMLENRAKYKNGNEDKAIITVDVIEARNLLPMDMNGFSDPFVVLTLGGDTVQTTYKKNELNPVWNESFIFEADIHETVLDVKVMD